MKVGDTLDIGDNATLISRSETTPAKIARQLVASALKTYVAEDIPKAVEGAIDKFAQQMRLEARRELERHHTTSVNRF